MVRRYKIDIMDMVGMDHFLDFVKKIFFPDDVPHPIMRDLMILTKAAF